MNISSKEGSSILRFSSLFPESDEISSLISPLYRYSSCFPSAVTFTFFTEVSMRLSTLSTFIRCPSLMMAALSQYRLTSVSTWVESIQVVPCATYSFISSKKVFCIRGSSPLVGSSKIKSFGLCCIAQIIETFFLFLVIRHACILDVYIKNTITYGNE